MRTRSTTDALSNTCQTCGGIIVVDHTYEMAVDSQETRGKTRYTEISGGNTTNSQPNNLGGVDEHWPTLPSREDQPVGIQGGINGIGQNGIFGATRRT